MLPRGKPYSIQHGPIGGNCFSSVSSVRIQVDADDVYSLVDVRQIPLVLHKGVASEIRLAVQPPQNEGAEVLLRVKLLECAFKALQAIHMPVKKNRKYDTFAVESLNKPRQMI